MASKKQNTLLNFFKPKEKQDDPMSIVKNTDYPGDSLLMCDQSPKVNDLNNTLDNTIEKESDLSNSKIGTWFMF